MSLLKNRLSQAVEMKVEVLAELQIQVSPKGYLNFDCIRVIVFGS